MRCEEDGRLSMAYQESSNGRPEEKQKNSKGILTFFPDISEHKTRKKEQMSSQENKVRKERMSIRENRQRTIRPNIPRSTKTHKGISFVFNTCPSSKATVNFPKKKIKKHMRIEKPKQSQFYVLYTEKIVCMV